ncbi:MAG: hypothetical protein ABH869_05455 [Candidatus Omnitrophota bacterium]
MKPRKNFRSRPKKSGAKKRQKVLSQKRKLVIAGYDAAVIDKKTPKETRELLKTASKKKATAPKKKAETVKSA